jgi:integrase
VHRNVHHKSVSCAHRRIVLYLGFNMSLSDSKLRNIKTPYSGKREISDRDGLTVRITANAIISFNYRFRWQGKQQRIKVGRYPDIKLSDARIRAGEYRQALLDGLDPRSYAVSQKNGRLLGELCDDFMSIYAYKELSPRTIVLYESFLNKYIKPNATIDVERYKYTDWIKFFDTIRKKTSAGNAGSILKRIKTVVRWSKSRGEIANSHCLDIPIKAIGAHQNRRERVLEWKEVAGLWRQIESSKATPKCKICVQLLILTGARNSEIREANRSEFDLENALWALPKARSKTKKAIRRPLSSKSIELIKALDLIYGSDRTYLIEGDKLGSPLTTHAINRFVKRMNNHLKYEPFVPHDFRRTIVTRLSENKVAPHVTEKMLGHELGGIMVIYNKHDWLDEQREAYSLYWDLLEQHLRI